METYKYILAPTGELYHYGVKGMKWGVTQAREAGRELNRKKRAYNRAKLSRNVSLLRGESGMSVAYKTDNYNQAKYEYKQAKKEFNRNAPTRVKVERGAANTAKTLAKIGALHVIDKKYFGGAGTASAKIAAEAAIKVVGMTTITAVSLARGHSNLKWNI
jgi:hypothetical protein